METINPKPIELKDTTREDETIYTWAIGEEELARVVARETSSYYPKIEFSIKEELVPYYKDDKKNALDEIREMSAYDQIQIETKNGIIRGNMRCIHNPSLAVDSFVQSIKGWLSKL